MKTDSPAAPTTFSPSSSYTLLLVDDNPTNLGVLFETLRDSEFRLLVAEDGEAALEQVQYVKPDIILLDVMMPRMNGFETCQRLKANPNTQDIPVIFMTALDETVDKVKGLSIGGVDYITKPIQFEEVLARVRVHLKLYTLQQQLQSQNQQLQAEIQERQQAERSLQLMVRAVSHDLKNPVTGMLMVLHNLLKSSSPEQPAEHSRSSSQERSASNTVAIARPILERMVESAERQLSLINSLLDIHNLTPAESESEPANPAASQPHVVLQRKSLSLHAVVSSVVQDLEPLLQKNQVHLDVQVPETLPFISGDSNQLWRVFENLITNAIKHNPPGIEVAIAAQPQIPPDSSVVTTSISATAAEFIQCWIKDNGNGIPLDDQPQLFELYRRGSAHHRSPGIGLGLYLCRQIIEAHGGSIELHSIPGQGTTFGFSLPIAQTAHPDCSKD